MEAPPRRFSPIQEKLDLSFTYRSHIESSAGATAKDLFASRGESAFRKLESDALAFAVEESEAIVALDGAAPDFRSFAKNCGLIAAIPPLADCLPFARNAEFLSLGKLKSASALVQSRAHHLELTQTADQIFAALLSNPSCPQPSSSFPQLDLSDLTESDYSGSV